MTFRPLAEDSASNAADSVSVPSTSRSDASDGGGADAPPAKDCADAGADAGAGAGAGARARDGLFGFRQQSALGLPRLPPLRIGAMLAFVLLAYGTAMTANGAAARLVPPRFLVPPNSGAVSALALVVRVFDPGAVIAGSRCAIMLGLVVPAIVLARDLPPGGAWALPTTPRLLLTPVLIGVTNTAGFLPYMLLTSVSGVALWAALISLYVLGPVLYGVLLRGESRAPRKLLGIALAVLAATLLGLPSADGAESVAADAPAGDDGLPGWARLLLFALTCAVWAVCDTAIAYVGREVHVLHVAVLSSVGFGATALACSAASYALVAAAGGGQLYSPAAAAAQAQAQAQAQAAAANATAGAPGAGAADALGAGAVGGGYAVLLFAQLAGCCGWYVSVRLGMASEASAFLPVLCLYTVPVSVFSVAFLGERLSAAGWAGVVLAGAGMLLIASA